MAKLFSTLSRRDFVKGSAGLAAGLALPAFFPGKVRAAPTDQPNIIMILADDLGYECLSCYGSASGHTPALDKLAASGVRFTACHAQPLCTPSRVELMTGQYNHRNYTKFGELDSKEKTFGNLFHDAGYATGIVGKWQLDGDLNQPQHFGFDDYCLWSIKGVGNRYWQPVFYENGKLMETIADKYGPDVQGDWALDFIARKRSKPFFLYYPMLLPHFPIVATPDSQGEKGEHKTGKYFWDMVAYMDKLVGQLVKRLEELKLLDNTLILFTGDNGTFNATTKMKDGTKIQGGKNTITDAGTHVPLLAFWGGKSAKGAVCNDLVDFSDFLPTLAEAARVPLPKDRSLDGRSFLPQIFGQKGNPRDWTFCWFENQQKRGGYFARDKRWKLCDDGRMFDLEKDILELHPLAPDSLSGEAAAAQKKLSAVFQSLKPRSVARKPKE